VAPAPRRVRQSMRRGLAPPVLAAGAPGDREERAAETRDHRALTPCPHPGRAGSRRRCDAMHGTHAPTATRSTS
jgi:hypothetical protein